MTKKMTEKTVDEKKLDKKSLRAQAKSLGIDSDTVLDYLEDDDLEGLATLIDIEKQKIAEKQEIVELVKSSGLNKQERNVLGVWYTGNMDNWNLFTTAATKWLQPVAELVMTSEFQEFMNSDKRLADVQKFVEYLEKK